MSRYTLYVKDTNPENNMTIECSDKDDLAHYASSCIKQGYVEVKAIIEEGQADE